MADFWQIFLCYSLFPWLGFLIYTYFEMKCCQINKKNWICSFWITFGRHLLTWLRTNIGPKNLFFTPPILKILYFLFVSDPCLESSSLLQNVVVWHKRRLRGIKNVLKCQPKNNRPQNTKFNFTGQSQDLLRCPSFTDKKLIFSHFKWSSVEISPKEAVFTLQQMFSVNHHWPKAKTSSYEKKVFFLLLLNFYLICSLICI